MTILQKHLVFITLFSIAFIVIFGGGTMLLWNWLMPEIFKLPCLSFPQAVGLLILCKILFGGFGGGIHGHGHGHCEGNKLRKHWKNMSSEERERIIRMHKAHENAD